MKKPFFKRFFTGGKLTNMSCGKKFRSRTRMWKGWKIVDENLREIESYTPDKRIDEVMSDMLLDNPTFKKLYQGG